MLPPTERLAPRLVQDRRPRPGHAVEDDQSQARPRHVDAVAYRVGAEQAGVALGAEDVDQGGEVEAVDMLRIERQPRLVERRGDAAVHALDRKSTRLNSSH